jgi:hypothetical protein
LQQFRGTSIALLGRAATAIAEESVRLLASQNLELTDLPLVMTASKEHSDVQ